MLTACISAMPPPPKNLELQPLASRNVRAEEIVRRFADAYNAGDVDAMMATAAQDIVWLDVKGDETSVVTKGVNALRQEMTGFFDGDTTPSSAVAILTSHGDFVTTLERAYYTVDGKAASQASFAIYEIETDKIRRVWYYPAQK